MQNNNQHQNANKGPKEPFKFKIENDIYETSEPTITGSSLKTTGGIPSNYPLYQKNHGQDQLVSNDATVNLSGNGIEQFNYKLKQSSVILQIEVPAGDIPFAEYSKNDTIQSLITLVVNKYTFAADGNYKIKIKGAGDFLSPTLTLNQAGISDFTTLVFTDLGKGANG